MGCGSCGSNKDKGPFVVRLPGQDTREVQTEAEAQQLTTGVRGAFYRPKR